MDLLKKMITEKGIVLKDGVLKVDSFLNHCIDPQLMKSIGKEFYKKFKDEGITKVLTLETSGIAPAVFTALELEVPLIFAKKTQSKNSSDLAYESNVHSFTKGKDYRIRVSKEYLLKGDRVLIIDDFLANGQAAKGLCDLIEKSGASLAGIGIVIEKGFQKGGALLREKGIRVHSLAIIENMSEKMISFRNEEEK